MQKVKDYFTIWNTGVSFIYGILGVIYSYAIIETVETYNKYKEYYSMSSKSIWTPGMVLTIVFSIVFLATGVLNLIHTRKYYSIAFNGYGKLAHLGVPGDDFVQFCFGNIIAYLAY